MDIIGSIFAYLGCVTGIVGALAISFLVVFASPEPPATPLHAAAMTARQTPKKRAAVRESVGSEKLELGIWSESIPMPIPYRARITRKNE